MFCVKTKYGDEKKWIPAGLFDNEAGATIFTEGLYKAYANVEAKCEEIEGDMYHFVLIAEQAFTKLKNFPDTPDDNITSEKPPEHQ